MVNVDGAGASETWVTCWTDQVDDALTGSYGNTLIPGGRWLLDLLVPLFESRGARLTGIGFEYSGYWWMNVDMDSNSFLILVYFDRGLGNVRVKRRKRIARLFQWGGTSLSEQQLADVIIGVLNTDRRVRRAKVSSGFVEQ